MSGWRSWTILKLFALIQEKIRMLFEEDDQQARISELTAELLAAVQSLVSEPGPGARQPSSF